MDTYFYSPSTGGFYLEAIHGDAMPDDALSLGQDAYTALMDGQSAGKVIMPPDEGHDLPYLADPPPPTKDILAANARRERDRLLAETDFLIMPDYPLDEKARAAVTLYRQALRDISKQEGFPETILWPEKPEV